ncbi:multisubunit sodium/proton antiporter MrpE subunit [Actinomadura hallensis]|uniref:Multisubunit sodium/proton antiporter MrpE subunit n=1 Tax=Actinomadura hallensis TaxID=337895 RepID=A0A543I7Q6_9ACTN|nr:multisubunit sodium/proton antiporter MrpE subunit [Actinomadura hallensis]
MLARRRGTALVLAPLLAAFWLVMSGHLTWLHLTLGALSVALVIWVVWRMQVVDKESLPLRIVPRLPLYLLWLVGQIMLSALSVLRLVWSPRRRIRPAFGTVPAAGMSEVAKVVYANSITLTPGTLSVSFRGGDVEVHSLVEDDLADLPGSAMPRRVAGLERR